QELEHRVLALPGPGRVRVHDHAVGDGRRAGGLQLGDALDLAQAHAARADAGPEPGLVAEDGDLDAGLGRRLDHREALGDRDLAAVDLQGDGVRLDGRHYAGSSSMSGSSSYSSSAMSISSWAEASRSSSGTISSGSSPSSIRRRTSRNASWKVFMPARRSYRGTGSRSGSARRTGSRPRRYAAGTPRGSG